MNNSIKFDFEKGFAEASVYFLYALAYPSITSFMTYGSPVAFTTATIVKKFGLKINLKGQDRHILKNLLEVSRFSNCRSVDS